MDPLLEKSSDSARGLLFGLLVNCIFYSGSLNACPLWELRNSLTIEQKHEYVMRLSDEEVKTILMKHEECYEKRLAEIKEW